MIDQSIRPTLAYSYVRGVIVYVGTATPPSYEDWAKYVEFVRAKQSPLSLVYEQGGAPNAGQRRALHEATKDIPASTVAVLTASSIGRTLVGVFAWIKPGYRAFSPDDTRGATAHLGLYGREADEVCAEMTVLRRRLQANP